MHRRSTHVRRSGSRIPKLSGLLLVLFLMGCGSASKDSSLTDVFPGADVIQGWAPTDQASLFDNETIFDLVNGQADAFFAYDFEQVAVQSYENGAGALRVEVWQLAEPADAYGLFTTSLTGTPIAVGSANDADTDPGRRLVYWQDRYRVAVYARQEVPDADLHSFAKSVSAALPSGGERPSLVDRLPPSGLVERSAIFFHLEISIQDRLWLGGENVLDLSLETDGVLATYDIGGTTAQLLLVQYPEPEAATVGLEALENAQISELVTSTTRNNLLGAVFGEADERSSSMLLAEAVGTR